MEPLSLPSHFALVYYRFTIRALDELRLPTYKGSVLRGGFGHVFKRLVCTYPRLCNQRCQLGNECPYGYVFETSPPVNTEVLSLNQQIPRPYIIEAPRDRREVILPGEQLTFGLTLIGHSMNFFPHFLAVFRELGWQGLGRTRGRYELLAIDAVSPFEGRVQEVYRLGKQEVRITDLLVTGRALTSHAAGLPANRITLEFLSPVQLKHRGNIVRQGPCFQALIRSLLGRASSLSYFHCGQRLEADFRGLVDRAEQVEIVTGQTRWEKATHFSGRQKQKIMLDGLVGKVTYTGKLREFLPLLLLGEFIQAGKGTVRGNGQYQILEEQQ